MHSVSTEHRIPLRVLLYNVLCANDDVSTGPGTYHSQYSPLNLYPGAATSFCASLSTLPSTKHAPIRPRRIQSDSRTVPDQSDSRTALVQMVRRKGRKALDWTAHLLGLEIVIVLADAHVGLDDDSEEE
eukprot:1951822-Rhodomonas_salina.1